MKNKQTLVLGAIFLVLVVIFMITSYRPEEVSRGASLLFEGDKPSVDKMEVTRKATGTVTLEKRNGTWHITKPIDYKASDVVVERTLDNLLRVFVDDVVSSRTDQQATYQVTDSTGVAVKLYSDGDVVLDAILGKMSLDITHTYARRRGSNDIELWRGMIGRQMIKEINDWRDKGIYSINADDILSVRAVEDGDTRELTLQDSTWVYTENDSEKPVDPAKATRFIAMLSNLSCDAFAAEDDIPRVGDNPPDVTVSFTIRNGDTLSYDVWKPGENDDNRYLLRKVNGDMLFRFYEYRGSQLTLDYEKLKPADS